MSREPTLLEDMAMAADIACEYAAITSGQKQSHLDSIPETPFAARLRAHAARLRAEISHLSAQRGTPAGMRPIRETLAVLERINGGPLPDKP